MEKRFDSNDFVFVKGYLSLFRIDFKDIHFIEAQKNYILIHTSNNMFETYSSMKDIEKVLPENDFVRIQKSYIVRIDKISYIKYPNLMVENKMRMLQIGATYKENFFRKLKII